MLKTIEATYRIYCLKKYQIDRGFISQENIELIEAGLGLKEITELEELGKVWEAVADFFKAKWNETKSNYIEGSWILDSKSAWLEVVNKRAREIKAQR
jgi:hypothetical protein